MDVKAFDYDLPEELISRKKKREALLRKRASLFI